MIIVATNPWITRWWVEECDEWSSNYSHTVFLYYSDVVVFVVI